MFAECVDNPWVVELLQKMFHKNKKSKEKKQWQKPWKKKI